jgi:hypothetical protein
MTTIHSWSGSSWFLPVPSTEINIEWTAVLRFWWHLWECDVRAKKVFTKWLPRMIQIHLLFLAQLYVWTMGLFWRKYGFNDYTALNISARKWFREHVFLYILSFIGPYVFCLLNIETLSGFNS